MSEDTNTTSPEPGSVRVSDLNRDGGYTPIADTVRQGVQERLQQDK